jgi:predicted MPP superfamily phosphohydrolase
MRGLAPPILKPNPTLLTRRTFISSGFAASAGLALYSNEIGRHELEITHRTFPIRNLPAAFDGFRIVQFSDIHLAEYTEDFFLEEVIDRVNALNADLLLVTGDFISRGPLSMAVTYSAAARCAARLSRLTCPERYGILGNHDAIVGGRIIRDHLENNGLPVLVNEFVRVERGGAHIILSGLDDYSFGDPNPALGVPEKPDAPVILMVHEPDYVMRLADHRRGPLVDLVLSGHTHGGQVRIPGFRPLALPPFGKLFPEGHYLIGDMQLYVNRGIGTVGVPFRFNCPPEITVLTLKSTSNPNPGAPPSRS